MKFCCCIHSKMIMSILSVCIQAHFYTSKIAYAILSLAQRIVINVIIMFHSIKYLRAYHIFFSYTNLSFLIIILFKYFIYTFFVLCIVYSAHCLPDICRTFDKMTKCTSKILVCHLRSLMSI